MNTQEMKDKAKDVMSSVAHAVPEDIKQRVSNKKTWFKLLPVLLVFVLFAWLLVGILVWITGLLMLVQFGFVLFTGHTNVPLNNINRGLARYVGQLWEYLLFCSDRFPLPEWLSNSLGSLNNRGGSTESSPPAQQQPTTHSPSSSHSDSGNPQT